jgi:biotin carboxyl carrier protein
MLKKQLNQSGFAHFIVIIVVVAVIAAAGLVVLKQSQHKNITYTNENAVATAQASKVKIKNLPINIDKYSPATGMAGDIKFPTEAFSQGSPDMVFMGYGFVVPGANNSQGRDKANPQPTFLAPAGTKVHALIDGKVVEIPSLYSKDFSIITQGKGSDLVFETEHVMNVKVKVGDQVKAGDVIAEVSTYDARNTAGLGVVEMGVLQTGNPPAHLCTFDFLDDSIKASTLQKITQLEGDWETFRGNNSLYGQEPVAGCLTHNIITDNNNSQTGKANN